MNLLVCLPLNDLNTAVEGNRGTFISESAFLSGGYINEKLQNK